MLINFWRPINMREPVRNYPLALCDPLSVDADDIFSARIPSVNSDGRVSRHLALRFNPRQQWRYFPAMTTAEVLVFKQCEFWKGRERQTARQRFPQRFRRSDQRRRTQSLGGSCEHRVGVMILCD